MNLISVVILIIGIVLIVISWLRSELKCPPPRIVYRYIPKHSLDIQFGDENKASDIFFELYKKKTPWVGGYDLAGVPPTIVLKDSIDEIKPFTFLTQELEKLNTRQPTGTGSTTGSA